MKSNNQFVSLGVYLCIFNFNYSKEKKYYTQQQYPTTKNTTMRKNMKGF